MQTESLSRLLRDISFSADLPDELLRKLAAISHVREFPKAPSCSRRVTRTKTST